MSHNQTKLLLSDEGEYPEWFKGEHSEWFRLRNINKWIHKLWKPRIIGMDVGKYEGEWKDGQMHGKGTLRISRIFRGYLDNLCFSPFGWRLIDQGEYVGEWKNGKEHGKGIRFYRAGIANVDTSIYEGEWKDGKYHGQGTFIFPDGHKKGEYIGKWKNGLEHGQGTKIWPDGRKFIGKWKKGKFFHGTFYFANGDKHFGFFKDNVAKGVGTRIYSDGRKYTGEFKCRESRSEGTCVFTGRTTVGKSIESIPTGFDTNQNYIGLHYVKYKEEKPPKTKIPFISKLIQKIGLKKRPLSTT